MPFEYTPYRSPFTGAIADLIGRQGDIAAQQALNEAKARTQAVSGVAQSLGNLAQYQADAPKRRLEQAMLAEKQQQLADAQEARAGKQSLATLLSPDYVQGFQPQGPTPVDASGEAGILPKSRSLVKDIGGVKQLDPDAIQAAMGQLGHGAWFLENRNTIDNLNKSMLDRYVLGQKAIQNAADLYKKAARRSQDTLDDRFKVQAAQALVDALDNIIPGDQLEAIQKALGVGDTRMIDQFADQYAPDKVELVKTGPNEVITPLNQYGEQVGAPIKGAPVQPPFQMVQAIALGTPPEKRTPEQIMLAAAWQKEHPGTKLTPAQLYFDAVARQLGKSDASELTADELGQAQRQYRDNTTRPVQDVTASRKEDIHLAAQDIAEGKAPPPSLERNTAADVELRAELRRLGVNATKLITEWNASKTFVRGLNSNQRTQYNQLAVSAVNTIDQMKRTANELGLSGPNELNKITKSVLAKWANENNPRARAAVKYLADAAAIKEELAQLASGGYKPTEKSFDLAQALVNQDYNVGKLHEALDETARLMRIRVNSVAQLTPQLPGSAPMPESPANATTSAEF